MKLKLEKGSKILLWPILILVILDLLVRFSIITPVGYSADVVTLFYTVLIFAEAGILVRSKIKIDWIRMLGIIVASVSFLMLILGWLGTSISVLDAWKGTIALLLLIFVIIELFR